MEKEISTLRQKLATGGGADNQAENIGNISFIGKVLAETPPRDLKPMADSLRQGANPYIICLVSAFEGKASIVVSVSDALTQDYNAVDLVKLASEAVGGKGGGGRPDMAQAGGPDADKADAAIAAVRSALGG
jgi:alanyl-tRNA synthetase